MIQEYSALLYSWIIYTLMMRPTNFPKRCNAEGFLVFPAVTGTVIDDDVSRSLVSLIFWSMELKKLQPTNQRSN